MEHFAELATLGIPAGAIERLTAACGPQLYPLQQRVLSETGLLTRGEDLLVAAPTASGKTLLAEMAALACFNRSRLALYLVPTRALAEQKAADFAARYGPLGVRVACSTRDRREADPAILDGAVHLTVAVYEKALSLLASRPGLLARYGLLVADEVQLLGDAERGAAVDLFLTRWRRANPRPQLLALSAVLGNPEELADWLGVRLVRSEHRPVPLREGVLDLSTGEFRWRDSHSGETGREKLFEPTSGEEPATSAVIAGLARKYGGTIVFCATRREAEQTAFALAEAAPFPAAGDAIEDLRGVPLDRSRERLESLLTAGVALHTADMPAAQRRLVEQAFGRGEVAVLVATPTLEQGVNLSAAIVIQTPLMVHSAETGAALLPLSRARFVNQGGRAGRHGDSVGRAMVFAESPAAADQCWRTFIAAPLEPVVSSLGSGALMGEIATLLSAGETATRDGLAAIFRETLGSRRHGAVLEDRLERDLAEGMRAGMWFAVGERLEPTALGEVVARTAIESVTAARWCELLRGLSSISCTRACLFLLMLAEEWDRFPLTVDVASRRRNLWPTGLRDRLSMRDELAARLRGRLESDGGAPFAFHRAARRTLLLDDWLAGASLAELEYTHALPSGQIARLASDAAWLASSAADVAGVLNLPVAAIEKFEQLAESLGELVQERGTRDEEQGMRDEGGGRRGEERRDEGRGTRDEKKRMKDDEKDEVISGTETFAAPAKAVFPIPEFYEQGDEQADSFSFSSSLVPRPSALIPPLSSLPPPLLAGATLRFPAHDAGAVEFCGQRIRLTPLPYQLLRLLASRPDLVVSYQEINEAIWPDAQVEQQMIPYHKKRIEQSLGIKTGELIETRFKNGLRLRLSESAIRFEEDSNVLRDSG